ncbi:MAG: hypothetical protein ACT4PT_01105 [Methanobacteriota archaeon]
MFKGVALPLGAGSRMRRALTIATLLFISTFAASNARAFGTAGSVEACGGVDEATQGVYIPLYQDAWDLEAGTRDYIANVGAAPDVDDARYTHVAFEVPTLAWVGLAPSHEARVFTAGLPVPPAQVTLVTVPGVPFDDPGTLSASAYACGLFETGALCLVDLDGTCVVVAPADPTTFGHVTGGAEAGGRGASVDVRL